MRQAALVVASAVAVAGFAAPAQAKTRVQELAESSVYKEKAPGMIGRGVLNVATCFVDVIAGVVQETRMGPPVIGSLVGLTRGTTCGVLRLGSGAVDITTFWIPGFNGLPVSPTYGDCLGADRQAAPRVRAPGVGEPEPYYTEPPPAPPSAFEPGAPAEDAARSEEAPKQQWYKK